MVIFLASMLFVVGTPEAEAATSRVLTISTASANPIVAFKDFDGEPPKIYDINGDGKLEIIVQNDNGWVYIFDSQSGKILFQVKNTVPPGWGARSINGPEAGILSQGGTVRLILASSAAVISSYRFDPGASSGTSFKFVKEWERRLNDCFSQAAMDAKPVFADLDKDGRFEILGATEEFGIYALRDDGRLYWKNCLGGGNADPAVADLNLDGWPDVVHVSDGGVVAALNGRTGGWMWGYNILAHYNIRSGSIPIGPGIGQLDGKGGPDIVVGARDSHDPNNLQNNHALLLALSSSGKVLWARQDPNGNPLSYTHPVIVDADGNGENEVYWADWNTIGHKGGIKEEDSWKVTGPGNFYRYDRWGNLVWKQSLNTYWSNKDIVLADVDGDGVQEVLANGPGASGDGIWYLDSRNGNKEAFVSTHPWKVSRGPIIGDLKGNGGMQWVVPTNAASNSVSGGAVLVYDTWVPYNSVYPHLPYPDLPNPGPPPGSGGTFHGTFTIKNPNSWWQEVTMAPDTPRTINRMDLRINDGSWMPMTKQSWGAWTSSHHTPAGAKVEFRAGDTGNAASQSAPFTWLDGVLSKRSVEPDNGPPPGGEFEATFTIPGNVNNWWVEVKVDSVQFVASVTASVDGGAPVALTKQSWGNWAKSFFVASGAQVVFEATSTGGAKATSEPFTWLGPPPPPPPPPGPLNASFAIPGNVNNWWVEVKVTANNPLAKVEAQVDGGAWIALDKKPWGNWAKSFFIETGSDVRFRATDNWGDQVVSETFPWLVPEGPFNATFTPKGTTNNWWVEVTVTATHKVVSVDARVNNGSWVPLAKQSWAAWAKSFFVPNGAEVQFRASNGIDTIESDPYIWG